MSARRDCSTYSNPACNLPAAAVTIRNTPGSVPGKDAQATGGVGAEPPQRGSESRPPGRHCGRRRRWPQATGQRRSPRRVSWPVGRVLCARLRGPTAIHLGLSLPTASCGLPASIGRAALERLRGKPRPEAPPSLFDLAPGGVYRAAGVTSGAGGLLHHRFTLTPGPLPVQGRSAFCGTVPRVTPGRRYRPPCPAEPGPSSPRPQRPRRDRPASSPA